MCTAQEDGAGPWRERERAKEDRSCRRTRRARAELLAAWPAAVRELTLRALARSNLVLPLSQFAPSPGW